ncbi:MAG: NAD(P)H-hydrate dehydratase [Burkholderiaceae bacterium]|nr:NAD(P)H-hydrate dehydratase [Burkholderiaceae bacterium]
MPERLDFRQPHRLFDTAATRRIEQAAASHLPPHALMQRAGLALARLALALAPHARRMWIACGPGNNGGDGLEAASHLWRWGVPLTVTWLGAANQAPADARVALARASAAGVQLVHEPPADLGPQDLCIDALLGIGAARPPAGRMADWLRLMRTGAAPLLAVDLPSGLNADTGVLSGDDALHSIAFAPCHTLTLLTLKPGLFTSGGRDACGTLWFDDLGVTSDETPTAILSGAPSAAMRPHASHKGSFGDVAVIGGLSDRARGIAMTGAALLAASAALHGGAGRVYVAPLSGAGDPGSAPMFDPSQPELMFRRWDALALQTLTVVCGCGGGELSAPAVTRPGGDLGAALPEVLRRAPRLVLDADALNAIAADAALAGLLAERAGREQVTVLTPHPLEAARLLATDARAVQADRLAAARALAARWRAIVVLKGSGTLIAAPNEVPRLNPTGNARLATPGTGDVLAGLIGAYLAAGQNAFATPLDAVCAAIYRHGQIADEWRGPGTLTAGALARQVVF